PVHSPSDTHNGHRTRLRLPFVPSPAPDRQARRRARRHAGGPARRLWRGDEIGRLLGELLELEIAQLVDGRLIVALDRVLRGRRIRTARAGLYRADQDVVLALHGDGQIRGGEPIGGKIGGRVAEQLRNVQAAVGAGDTADRGGGNRFVSRGDRPLSAGT